MEWFHRDEGMAASGPSFLLCRPISIIEHTSIAAKQPPYCRIDLVAVPLRVIIEK